MLGKMIGNYRLTSLIAAGGMGAVYEAIHDSVGTKVAVKVLREEYASDREVARRFLEEARIMGAIDHPGVVRIIDCGKMADGTAYIMMERLHGETLSDRLTSRMGRLPVGEALRLARQTAEALQAAHARGVIHRDIKLGNIFIVPEPEADEGERVKVIDFGLAKRLRKPLADDALRTLPGMVIGTPYYMSPEQCLGEMADAKADVYSLGALLYLLLCGDPPFLGRNDTDVMSRQVKEEPRPLLSRDPSLPAEAGALVQVMLLKDRRLRPSMAQVAERLRQLEGLSAQDATIIGGSITTLAALHPPQPAPLVALAAERAARWPQVTGLVLGLLAIGTLGMVLGRMYPLLRAHGL